MQTADAANVQTSEAIALTIEGTTNPTIIKYFETLNAGNFAETSDLFATDGEMQPPFESSIVGRDAIIEYLRAEAKGMTFQPSQALEQEPSQECTEVQVSGKVQTPLFGVNVSWRFVLNSEQEISLVKIKLLASPQELLNLRR